MISHEGALGVIRQHYPRDRFPAVFGLLLPSTLRAAARGLTRASSVPSVASSGTQQSHQRKKATNTLAAYNLKLREETDLDTLTEEVLEVVRQTVQPEHASLWLRLYRANAKEDVPR